MEPRPTLADDARAARARRTARVMRAGSGAVSLCARFAHIGPGQRDCDSDGNCTQASPRVGAAVWATLHPVLQGEGASALSATADAPSSLVYPSHPASVCSVWSLAHAAPVYSLGGDSESAGEDADYEPQQPPLVGLHQPVVPAAAPAVVSARPRPGLSPSRDAACSGRLGGSPAARTLAPGRRTAGRSDGEQGDWEARVHVHVCGSTLGRRGCSRREFIEF